MGYWMAPSTARRALTVADYIAHQLMRAAAAQGARGLTAFYVITRGDQPIEVLLEGAGAEFYVGDVGAIGRQTTRVHQLVAATRGLAVSDAPRALRLAPAHQAIVDAVGCGQIEMEPTVAATEPLIMFFEERRDSVAIRLYEGATSHRFYAVRSSGDTVTGRWSIRARASAEHESRAARGGAPSALERRTSNPPAATTAMWDQERGFYGTREQYRSFLQQRQELDRARERGREFAEAVQRRCASQIAGRAPTEYHRLAEALGAARGVEADVDRAQVLGYWSDGDSLARATHQRERDDLEFRMRSRVRHYFTERSLDLVFWSEVLELGADAALRRDGERRFIWRHRNDPRLGDYYDPEVASVRLANAMGGLESARQNAMGAGAGVLGLEVQRARGHQYDSTDPTAATMARAGALGGELVNALGSALEARQAHTRSSEPLRSERERFERELIDLRLPRHELTIPPDWSRRTGSLRALERSPPRISGIPGTRAPVGRLVLRGQRGTGRPERGAVRPEERRPVNPLAGRGNRPPLPPTRMPAIPPQVPVPRSPPPGPRVRGLLDAIRRDPEGRTRSLAEQVVRLGHILTEGHSTIAARTYSNGQGRTRLFAVVTRGLNRRVIGAHLAEHIEVTFTDVDVEPTVVASAGQNRASHAERVLRDLDQHARARGFTPTGTSYINRVGCCTPCELAQAEIDAQVLVLPSPGRLSAEVMGELVEWVRELESR